MTDKFDWDAGDLVWETESDDENDSEGRPEDELTSKAAGSD